MNKQLSKNILITGVATGIGYGCAVEFIKRGYQVFGSVRKIEDASKLREEFGESFIPLIFDVTDQVQVDAAVVKVSDLIGDVGLACLINNSGIAMGGPLMHQSMEEIEYHFQVNVMGLIRVTKAFLPLLGARENHKAAPGKIINISSVAGRFAQPFVGAYVGSKHAVEGMSHSLRRELLIYGIDVVIIGPGAVKTPIWDKGINMEPYMDTIYGPILKEFAKSAKEGCKNGLSVAYLAQNIVNIFENPSPKSRYPFVPQKFKSWTLPMLMPDRVIDRMIKKMFRIK